MRSGDEPGHARSALRLRAALAGFGLATALAGAVVIRPVAPGPVVGLFVVVAALAALDLLVIVRRIRQGAHFQPGPDVPAYRPVDPPQPRSAPRTPVSERTRMRRYLILMGSCVGLLVLAWFWVRLYSTTAAVVLSAVAAVLPPIAVVVANHGRLPPRQPPPNG